MGEHQQNMSRKEVFTKIFTKCFESLDADGDGGLDRTEVKAMLQKMGAAAATMGEHTPSAEELNGAIDEMFAEYDTDGDGKLTVVEVLTKMQSDKGDLEEGLSGIPDEIFDKMVTAGEACAAAFASGDAEALANAMMSMQPSM